jgi:hypothetical protein
LNQAKSIDQALAEAFLKADQLAAPLVDQRLKLYLGESRALLPDLESTYDPRLMFNATARRPPGGKHIITNGARS